MKKLFTLALIAALVSCNNRTELKEFMKYLKFKGIGVKYPADSTLECFRMKVDDYHKEAKGRLEEEQAKGNFTPITMFDGSDSCRVCIIP